MEVKEIREKMIDLEETITKLITDFTKECGVEVDKLTLNKDIYDNGAFRSIHDSRICMYGVEVKVRL